MKKIPVILVGGGSCSGKSVLAQLFKNAFVLEMDHFYLGKSQLKPEADGTYNFDAPSAVDLVECSKAVKKLARSEKVTIPTYDMRLCERVGTQELIIKPHTKFIVVEGIFALQSPLLELGDLKIFVDTPTEIRVARRILRDGVKGRSDIDTLAWSITVEKNHKLYIEPTKQYADLIIPFSYNPVQFLT